jgi:hypothetical protein
MTIIIVLSDILLWFHAEQQTVIDTKSVETCEPAESVFVNRDHPTVRVCRKCLTNFTVEIRKLCLVMGRA